MALSMLLVSSKSASLNGWLFCGVSWYRTIPPPQKIVPIRHAHTVDVLRIGMIRS